MAARSLGTLTLDLVAKIGGFEKGMDKAQRKSKKTMSSIERNTNAAAKAVLGLGIAAAGATVALVKSQINAADELAKTSRMIGVQVEELSALKYGGSLADVAFTDLTTSMTRFARIISETNDGTGEGVEAFKKLGISIYDNEGKLKTSKDLLYEVADGFKGMKDGVEKTAIAADLMGRSGTKMINLLNGGSEGLAQFKKEANDLGLVVSEKTAVASEEFNDSLTRLKSSITGAGNGILENLLPVMQDFTDLMSDPKTIEGIQGLVKGVANLTTGMISLLGSVGGVTKFIAEEIASAVNGPAFDDIVRIEEKILDIREKIAALGDVSKTRSNVDDNALVALKKELATYTDLKNVYYESRTAIEGIGKAAGQAIGSVAGLKAGLEDVGDTTPKIRETGRVLQRILDMQNDDFGWDWGGDDDPFADNSELTDANKKAVKSVDQIGVSYNRVGSIAGSVVNDIAFDSENAFDNMGESFKRLLSQMAQDAINAQIQISLQADSSGTGDAESAGSAIGAGGWVGLVVVAIAALGQVRNKNEAEKWDKFTSEYRQGSQATGTVLGLLDQKSQSLNNLIEDIGSDNINVLDVNYAMLSALLDIKKGITGVADGFAKTGFGDAGSAAFAQVSLGTRAKKAANFGEWDYLADNTESAEIIGALTMNGISHFLSNQFGEEVFGFIGSAVDGIAKNVLRYETEITDSGIEIFGASLASIVDGGVLQAQAYADITRTKKFLGIDTKTTVETLTEGLDEVTRNQLSSVFEGAGNALAIASEEFGIDFASRAGELFIEGGRLSLKDLTGDELSDEIAAFFSANFDAAAGTLLEGTSVLADFQQVGEGAFETMLRLASETASFTDATERLGLNFSAVGEQAVYATQQIIDAAGGYDVLSANLNSFTARFTSEADQLQTVTDQLSNVFDSLGQTVPESNQAFSDLVRGIDITTEAGSDLFASLISISEPMADYLTALERQKEETQKLADLYEGKEIELLRLQGREIEALSRQRALDISTMDESLLGIQRLIYAEEDLISARNQAIDATDSAMSDLREAIDENISGIIEDYSSLTDGINAEFDAKVAGLDQWLDTQLEHYQRRAKSLQDSIGELTGLSGALESALNSLKTESTQRGADYRSSVSQLDDIARSVASGGALPTADLINSISGGLGDSTQYFSNLEDYIIAQSSINSDLVALKSATDTQLSVEERALLGIERLEAGAQSRHDERVLQVEQDRDAVLQAAEDNHTDQIAQLEAQYKAFEDQVNELRGIDTSVKSVEQAVNSLTTAISDELKQQQATQLARLQSIDEHLASIDRSSRDQADAAQNTYYDSAGAA